jgi:c-di-GMP-binding flagellar brake protein YcgR
VRSGIDIARTLRAICEGGTALTAAVQSGEKVFISKLLRVDQDSGFIVIACSDVKEANSALVAAGSAVFTCNHQGAHYGFSAGGARLTQHAGQAALRLAFPSAMLAQQRRARLRVTVPATVPLRCLVSIGSISFEARVVDISVEGLGSIVFDPRIRLEPGVVIQRARILHPLRDPIEVDLLVRSVVRQTMPDGSYAARAGCSFVGAEAQIEDLIKLFVAELGP